MGEFLSVPNDFDVKTTKPPSNEKRNALRPSAAVATSLTEANPVPGRKWQPKFWFKTTQDIWMTSNQKVVARPNAAFQRRWDVETTTQAVIPGGLCVPDRVLIETLRSV
jgi:hypothetical protein